MDSPRSENLRAVGYATVLTVCAVFSLSWLTVGAIVAVVTYSPGAHAAFTASAADGAAWAHGVLVATSRSEPLGQAVLDYVFSALNLGLAVVLLIRNNRTWLSRLLAVAMVGSAGAFNLQAHAATVAVEHATGLGISGVHEVLMHGTAGAAYIVALLLFPSGRWEIGPSSGPGRYLAPLVSASSLVVVGVGTVLLPHTVICILFFGFALPLIGLAALLHRIRYQATGALRAQARLLSSVLLGAFGTAAVLGLLTFLLQYLGESGLTVVDPTAHGAVPTAEQPTALLFWFSRLAGTAIAGSALTASWHGRIWAAERAFSRGLASVLLIVLMGSGYVIARALADRLPGADGGSGTLVATVLAALVFLPLYARVEHLVDRLLYGTRPTPYSVLAEVTSLSQSSSTDRGPSFSRVAEAIGRGLGARSCRLTVMRPGLRDRTYAWTAGAAGDLSQPGDHVVLPIQQGAEQIGTIAVDRGAVAGLHDARYHLLAAIADSLGAVLQASRLGIELERQLRAALAHAERIAVSRRQAVAEMDSERRMIERDLHDGAQNHLVALRLALGLVEHEVASGQLKQARDRLGQITTQLSTAETVLAEIATGVSSIALSERGLVAALQADLAGAVPPIVVDTSGLPTERRFPPEVEAAVYYCCLESVNNARKHAQGAAVLVQVAAADGVLRFAVRDEGPGFELAATSGSGGRGGRGLRNLTARIATVGGQITIESAPGAGTTVRGWAPLPSDQGIDRVTEAGTSGDRGAPEPASLLGQVRELVRTARHAYPDGGESEMLARLADRLEEPLRVGIVDPPRSGASTLAEALGSPPMEGLKVIDEPLDQASEHIDALILLIRPGHADDVDLLEPALSNCDTPTPVIIVLVRVDEVPGTGSNVLDEARRAAREYRQNQVIRRRCHTVMGLSVLLACAGATLREDEYRALRAMSVRSAEEPAGRAHHALRERFGLFGVRLAIQLIQDGIASTRTRLAEELVRHSGVLQLRELLVAQVARRVEARRARRALLALDALVRAAPTEGDRTDQLLYQLEKIRTGAHEFAELDLADTLRAGALRLTDADRLAAERLLGVDYDEPLSRLGLTADADPDQVRQAAGEQLAHWQRLASHPASTTAVRGAAEVLVRTCEELLAGSTRHI